MEVIPARSLRPARWSGGTTTQLFIFPPEASYAEMNFDFRISTATIEIDESTFTSLPGVQRTLMVLEGELRLTHQGHHQAKLHPFACDRFSGDWRTQSQGQAVDFNLMVRSPSLRGELEHLCLGKEKTLALSARRHGFLHVYRGSIELNGGIRLDAGDSVYFTEADQIRLCGLSEADLVLATVTPGPR